jgi:hypothetical protein
MFSCRREKNNLRHHETKLALAAGCCHVRIWLGRRHPAILTPAIFARGVPFQLPVFDAAILRPGETIPNGEF